MSATALAVHDLVVQAAGVRLLDGLSLRVEAGEWLAVIGPNGAGKSTMCRALVGLVEPTAGSIELCGRQVITRRVGRGRPVRAAGVSRRDRARFVAYVPQTPVVPAGFSVADYVLLGRTPYVRSLGTDSVSDRAAMDQAIRRLGLERFAGRDIATLSGGERQRVLLARALAQAAPILLLDEPTTALDLGAQQEVLELIDALRHEVGLAVVTTLHDLTLAGQYSDRLVLIDAGRAVATGSPESVLNEENIERFYGARMKVVYEHGRPVVLPLRGPVPVRTTGAEAG
ncbi:MAG TPA: ABC transporter ATP-binding protein [Actinomycetes bacterium]|jgi:iron complex transport system ATP-binding protein